MAGSSVSPSAGGSFISSRLPSPLGDSRNRSSATLAALALCVALAVAWTHWPSLSASAFCFDDHDYMVDNPLVRRPGWASARRLFAEVLEPSTVRGYYQPLSMVSLMLDCALGGSPQNLAPFHRTSLALHVANTVLVIALLYGLFGQRWPAALAGLLFGVHPLTVEPIPWVGERKTLLAAFFALACLLGYLRQVRRPNLGRRVAVWGLYVLALLSKPTSLPLPLMMLLLDYWPLRRFDRRAILEKLPLFVTGAAAGLIYYISQDRTYGTAVPTGANWLEAPLKVCYASMFYLVKIVWPADLSCHYPIPTPMSIMNPAVLAGLIGSLVLAIVLVVSLRWTRAAMIGWLIFLVGLLPTMQVIGFSDVIASDKFVYLPCIGLLAVIASALSRAWIAPGSPRSRGLRRSAVALAALALAGVDASTSRARLRHWRNSDALFSHMIALTPRSDLLHLGLAMAMRTDGRLDDAAAHLRTAIDLEPDRPESHAELGIVLMQLKRSDEAIDHYRAALRLRPDYPLAHMNLGVALADKGMTDEAAREYREALRLRPGYALAHLNLAILLSKSGDRERALEHCLGAIKNDPNLARAQYEVAVLLDQMGREDEAIARYRESIRLDPQFAAARNDLGVLLARRERYPEAAALFRESLARDPDDAQAHNNLGIVFDITGLTEKAERHFREAIRLRPNYVDAQMNLAGLLAALGRRDEAIGLLEVVLRLDPRHPAARERLESLRSSTTAPSR